MTGTRRPAFQDIWSAVRVGFTRLNSILAEPGDPQDMVFHVREPTDSWPSKDRGRARLADGGRDRDPKRDFN